MNEVFRRALATIYHIGADPQDDDDLRLQKALLVRSALLFAGAGLLWGALYFAFGQPLAGAIPLSYSCVSLLSLGGFALTRRYHLFRFSQLLLILLLPFLLMLALGGFITSSAVILWSLVGPVGALLFDSPRRALGWLLAYLGLVLLGGLLTPALRPPQPLPPSLVLLFFSLNVGAVSAIVIVLLHYFVVQKDQLLALLRLEQAKSESLLLNILPREIAAILKNDQRTIADYYGSASILFADMVNFTPLTAELAPAEMVELLNEVFSRFDALVEQLGLEKIRTIGDNYMVAAGVPRPRPDHAQALARLALGMRDFVQTHTFRGNRRLDFRIGINSGPVLAGVIGRKKFVYDLWGDAVNIASRMESQGAAGCIQVSRATYELIQGEFICQPRGSLVVKGKGEMEVWHVVGVQPAASTSVSPGEGRA